MSGREPTPRITPGGVRDIGLLNSVLVRALGVAARTGPPNLFTTLARHRSLFRRWLVFASGLMPGGRLPRADTELIILRVAHLCDCPYERLHHERLGREAGLSDAAVAATERPLDDGPWSARQRALLGARVGLYRALGGGWATDDSTNPAPTE